MKFSKIALAALVTTVSVSQMAYAGWSRCAGQGESCDWKGNAVTIHYGASPYGGTPAWETKTAGKDDKPILCDHENGGFFTANPHERDNTGYVGKIECYIE